MMIIAIIVYFEDWIYLEQIFKYLTPWKMGKNWELKQKIFSLYHIFSKYYLHQNSILKHLEAFASRGQSPKNPATGLIKCMSITIRKHNKFKIGYSNLLITNALKESKPSRFFLNTTNARVIWFISAEILNWT